VGIGLILGSTFFIWIIFSLTVDRLMNRRAQLALGQPGYFIATSAMRVLGGCMTCASSANGALVVLPRGRPLCRELGCAPDIRRWHGVEPGVVALECGVVLRGEYVGLGVGRQQLWLMIEIAPEYVGQNSRLARAKSGCSRHTASMTLDGVTMASLAMPRKTNFRCCRTLRGRDLLDAPGRGP